MVRVDRVSKSFRTPHAGRRLSVLENIQMGIRRNEFVSIVGRSGSGKTTLLKIIQGLIRPDIGQVVVGGRPVEGVRADLSFVFQDVGLLAWRNVLNNVALGLEARGMNRPARQERALKYIRMVGLEPFVQFYPWQLSGGMAQRVGLARALAMEPAVLLMDEPFGALDALTRATLQAELSRLSESLATTILFVTHDVDEAVFLSDRVIVMWPEPGRVAGDVAIDLPRPRYAHEIRAHPAFLRLRGEVLGLLGEGHH